LKQLTFKGNSLFTISGKICILDCVWNLSERNEDDESEFVHFQLNGGIFICNNMVVLPLNVTVLQFMSYTGNNSNSINCEKFIFRNIISNLSNTYFNLGGGEVNFGDCV
jgi:hypothetical protein